MRLKRLSSRSYKVWFAQLKNKMIIKTLKELFRRDLNKLKQEILAYQEEAMMWTVAGDIKNSGGNLCLHILGNLNAYIGIGLAQTNYVRHRDLEFSQKDIPCNQLLKSIDQTIEVVIQGLDNITPEQLNDDFPIIIWDQATEMQFTLIHLHGHLTYHLGQINYHRRLLTHSHTV